jgi:hypothetical protein
MLPLLLLLLLDVAGWKVTGEGFNPNHLKNHINNIGNCFKTGKFGRNIEKHSALNSRFIAYRPLFFKIINKSRTKQ